MSPPASCLNRTSVGLKRELQDRKIRFNFKPQSNQRGIETGSGRHAHPDAHGLNRTSVGLKLRPASSKTCASTWPQSNQRGIETPEDRHGQNQSLERPQSNQRGIETGSVSWAVSTLTAGLNRTSVGLKRRRPSASFCKIMGLNRTSVGLKHRPAHKGQQAHPRPQSNQRGIETCLGQGGALGAASASIEPAWD